ncbi:MAG: vWA domain-containing protein, partial [Paracoccus sp. (in: a-proteobacteria)]
MRQHQTWAAAVALSFIGGVASADSISPETFTADLAIGESVTIEKTVVISEGKPTSAPLDVMFLFDTTGSMGGEIGQAKSSAGDIITGLAALGSAKTGVAYYDDVLRSRGGAAGTGACGTTECGSISNLSFTATDTTAAINGLSASGGGDFAEEGNMGVLDVVDNASWRPDSNRFIIALGDAPFKNPPSDETVETALTDKGVNLIGINYGDTDFKDDIEDLGGTVFAGSSDGGAILTDILNSISAAFSEYNEVTLSHFGNAGPEIAVDVVCTGADDGVCVGDTASGDYDRSKERTFTFDVTFTRTAAGDKDFSIF